MKLTPEMLTRVLAIGHETDGLPVASRFVGGFATVPPVVRTGLTVFDLKTGFLRTIDPFTRMNWGIAGSRPKPPEPT